jgi:flavin reductase (DIM6/NTAB) family NADH-FMN oxidoreductase RutF
MPDDAGGDAITIDPALFRAVMGSFASGVTVITTERNGQIRGMTANAFMSGSLDPPLCVISVAKRARTHAILVETGHFGVSILAQDQEKLSGNFAGGPIADLDPAFVHVGRTPVLAEASATLTAEIVASYGCGDHTIFIGRITYMQAQHRPPLVTHRGRYASLSYSAERAPEWVADFW